MCKYCEYFNNVLLIKTDDIGTYVGILFNKLKLGYTDNGKELYAETPINYCPMCGRKLTEEIKEVK